MIKHLLFDLDGTLLPIDLDFSSRITFPPSAPALLAPLIRRYFKKNCWPVPW